MANHLKVVLYTSLTVVSSLMVLTGHPNFWLICTGILSFLGGWYGFLHILNTAVSRSHFFHLSAVVIVLASSVSLLIGCSAVFSISDDIWVLLLDATNTTTLDLALSQAYTNTFASCLWLLGNHLQHSGLLTAIHQDVTRCLQDYKRPTLLLIAIIIACQLYLLNHNIIVYGGKDLAHEGEPTHPLLALTIPFIPVVPFVLAYWLRSCLQMAQWTTTLLSIGILLGELYWFFLFGRRSVIVFFIFVWAGFAHGKMLSVRQLVKNIVPIVISLLLMVKIADTYHKMRTVYGFESLQQMSITEGITGLQKADDEKYGKIRKLNVMVRSLYSSLALGQFINLFRTTHHKPLQGKVLINSILQTTPSDFIVDKRSILAKEALYESVYGLRLTDISETLYLEAFIDFGWYGFFLYAGFVFALFYTIYLLSYHLRSPVFSLLVCCVSMSLALTMIESDMITFLSYIRVLFVAYLVTFLFLRKSKSETHNVRDAQGSKAIVSQ